MALVAGVRDSNLPLIVAIDLQPMAPIEGVIQMQGDIINARTAELKYIKQHDNVKLSALRMVGSKDDAKGHLVEQAKIEIVLGKTGNLDNLITTATKASTADKKE